MKIHRITITNKPFNHLCGGDHMELTYVTNKGKVTGVVTFQILHSVSWEI